MVTNEAFEAACEQYAPLINKFATRFSRNYSQREEVQSILMVELLLALQKHDATKSNMLTYLHNRFRWACLNQIVNSNSIVNKHEKSINSDDTSVEPNISIDQEDLFCVLSKSLDKQAQEVLVHMRAGHNLRQTGEIMQVSEQRVQQIFSRICEKGHSLTGQKRK